MNRMPAPTQMFLSKSMGVRASLQRYFWMILPGETLKKERKYDKLLTAIIIPLKEQDNFSNLVPCEII